MTTCNFNPAPPLSKRADMLFWSQAQRQQGFPCLHQRFPSNRIAAGVNPYPLPPGDPLAPRFQNELTRYMSTWHVAGLMVLQHGHIRFEHYAPFFAPDKRWTSFSVAKSVTALLAGIALKQGYIQSMHDSLATYIPALSNSAYADVTVHQLLTMTSGVRWNEDYADAHSDVARMYRQAPHHEQQVIRYLKQQPRQHPAGRVFNYNTAETDLLGIVIQRATQTSLAAYLSDTIWKPYGMATDAYWLKDEKNRENTGGSGLEATLADYARLGQFVLEGAKTNQTTLIDPAWLKAATSTQQTTDHPDKRYGYLWWIDEDNSYAAIGIFGQLIYIDPARHLVITQLAAYPAPVSDSQATARQHIIAAIKQSVDAGC